MSKEVLEMLIRQGGGYLFGGVIFFFYQKAMAGLIRDSKRVITENTKAFHQLELSLKDMVIAIKELKGGGTHGL
jgi:hypothetical protein